MADTSYYIELGLTRSATDADIKKAYRKLALKYHPDKDDSEAAAATFKAVAEAYDVLSDPKCKGFYDLYGEEALKNGLPDQKGASKGGFYKFEKSPLGVFEQFFGTANPYAALSELSTAFEAMTKDAPLQHGKQRTYTVGVTLEEVFYGCQKKQPHTKKIMQKDGSVETVQKILTLDVMPGVEHGQRFVFEKEGNEQPNVEPGPVVCVVETQPHDYFARKGSDLVFTAKLPLAKALTGTTIPVKTLDGRVLNIPIVTIVQPGETKVIPGEGLPDGSGGKGNLIVVFDLLFPRTLTESQKTLMQAAFFYPPKPNAEQQAAFKAFAGSFTDKKDGWSSSYPK